MIANYAHFFTTYVRILRLKCQRLRTEQATYKYVEQWWPCSMDICITTSYWVKQWITLYQGDYGPKCLVMKTYWQGTTTEPQKYVDLIFGIVSHIYITHKVSFAHTIMKQNIDRVLCTSQVNTKAPQIVQRWSAWFENVLTSEVDVID